MATAGPVHDASNYPHVGIPCDDSNEMPVLRLARRYSKAEEAMHEDDRPLDKYEERRFSSTEAPTVVTAPYIWSHSVEIAPDQLHLLSKLRKEDEEMKSNITPDAPSPPTGTLEHSSETHGRQVTAEENQAFPVRKMSIGDTNVTHGRKMSLGEAGRRLSFGEGGLGDHSARLWDWPLGENGKVEVHSTDTKFEAWFDFRPFQPKEIWVAAKVMGDDVMIHCESENAHPGNSSVFSRSYTLPMNCDARTARFRIKFGHTLVVSVDKDLPIKLAIASFGVEETKQNPQ